MSGRRDDGQEIQRLLEQSLEALLTEYFPGWVLTPNKSQALLTPKKKGKLVTSSFKVDLVGENRGRWYRFSEGKGGHALALLFYARRNGDLPVTKADWADAYGYAREFLGIADDQPQETEAEKRERERKRERDRLERGKRQEEEAKKVEARARRRSLVASEIFADSVLFAGSQAEAYLCGRNVPPSSEWPWSPIDTLRFHPSLEYWDGNVVIGCYPALVCAVLDAFGEFTAVWRIYLDSLKPKKCDDVPNAKVGLGPAAGGAVRLGGDGPRIGGGEGVESCISQWALHQYRFPIWSMLSTSGLQNFEPPIFVKRVDYFPDGDLARLDRERDAYKVLEPPGIAAARIGAARVKSMGIQTAINEPSLHGDGNDLLKAWAGRL